MPPPPISVIQTTASPNGRARELLRSQQAGLSILGATRSETRLRGAVLAEAPPDPRGVSALSVTQALAAQHAAPMVDLQHTPADPTLIARWGPHKCLQYGVLPWRRTGACTVILTTRPNQFARLRPALEACFGPVRMAFTTQNALAMAVTSQFPQELVRRAETRVPAIWSCRGLSPRRTLVIGSGILISLAVALFMATIGTLIVLTTVAITILVAQSLLKIACIVLALRKPPAEENPAVPVRLPTITILVPLFREKEITDHLLKRLRALDYPREIHTHG